MNIDVYNNSPLNGNQFEVAENRYHPRESVKKISFIAAPSLQGSRAIHDRRFKVYNERREGINIPKKVEVIFPIQPLQITANFMEPEEAFNGTVIHCANNEWPQAKLHYEMTVGTYGEQWLRVYHLMTFALIQIRVGQISPAFNTYLHATKRYETLNDEDHFFLNIIRARIQAYIPPHISKLDEATNNSIITKLVETAFEHHGRMNRTVSNQIDVLHSTLNYELTKSDQAKRGMVNPYHQCF